MPPVARRIPPRAGARGAWPVALRLAAHGPGDARRRQGTDAEGPPDGEDDRDREPLPNG